MSILKSYYYLTKPGIVYGNSIATIGGFFLASRGDFDFLILLAALLGISLVIASACVFNNYMDRDIDARMARTQNRALVTRAVPAGKAIAFGAVLGLLGTAILWFYTNPAATLAAGIGFMVYVALYSPLKRRTVHATLIGSISGATPPVVGYTAVTGEFDLGALLVFLVLVFWQMPHFYCIAINRLAEYRAASIPVMPIKKGILTTKIYIIVYVMIYTITLSLLTVFGFTGYIYLTVMLAISLIWLRLGLQGLRPQTDDVLWARKMFRFSLILLLLFSVMISIDVV